MLHLAEAKDRVGVAAAADNKIGDNEVELKDRAQEEIYRKVPTILQQEFVLDITSMASQRGVVCSHLCAHGAHILCQNQRETSRTQINFRHQIEMLTNLTT